MSAIDVCLLIDEYENGYKVKITSYLFDLQSAPNS